jgi:hypothetical protein
MFAQERNTMFITNMHQFVVERWFSGGMWIWTLGGIILLVYVIVMLTRKK